MDYIRRTGKCIPMNPKARQLPGNDRKRYTHIEHGKKDSYLTLSWKCGSYDRLDCQKYKCIESLGGDRR